LTIFSDLRYWDVAPPPYPMELLREGNWYSTPGKTVWGMGPVDNLSADVLRAHAFMVWTRRTVWDRIGISVRVASATAGAKARLGVYENGPNNYPGKLLLDAGEVDITSTGFKEIPINLVLDRGIYWIAFILSAGDAGFWQTSYCLGPAGYDINSVNPGGFNWEVSQTYGPLPDPFPSGASIQPYIYGVGLRLQKAYL